MKEEALSVVMVAIILATASAEKKVRFKNHEHCQAPPDTGLCGTSGTVRRWFFNADTAQCETFRWGFCGDQNNVFRSRSICERYCMVPAVDKDSTIESGNAFPTSRPFKREFTSPAPFDSTTPTDTATTGSPSSTTTTTTPTTTPVTTCVSDDCSLLSCSGSVVTSFDPDTGCPTCYCDTAEQKQDGNTTIPQVSEKKTIAENPCEYCDEVCRQADAHRDTSVECDVTHCRCATSPAENVPQMTSMCSEPSVECICSENEVATATVDENGCDKCECVEPELSDENQPIVISTSQFVCSQMDCDLTCDNENEAGFETDENGCHLCACRIKRQSEEDQSDMQTAQVADIKSSDSDGSQQEAVLCMDSTQCSVSCPFGYQVDPLTGCETCECFHLVSSDENFDGDYDEDKGSEQQTDISAPSLPPLCRPEVGCDTSSCIRAFDPPSKCDLCICDDDFGAPQIPVETNKQAVNAATGRDDVNIGNESSRVANAGFPEAEDEDDACVNQLSCDSACIPARNGLGCIVDCRCLDNIDVVTSPPLTEMNPCPEHRCSCEEEEGFEIVRFIDDDGCPACKCLPIVTVPATATEEVEEEIIVPVTASRQGDGEPEAVDEDIIVPVTASKQGYGDPEAVDEEIIVPVTAPTLGRDQPIEPKTRNTVSLPVADARKVWCSLLPERGPCQGNLERWYHDRSSGTCTVFIYSGCRGNANNFRSNIECQRYCKPEVSAERNEKRKWYKRILGFKHQ